jgi:alginate lyase
MRGTRPLALLSALFAGTALLTTGSSSAAPAACTYPAEVLDLTRWKAQLPVDDPNQSGTQILQVVRPRLNTYVLSPWFKPTSSCDGVLFRNAVNGVKTPNTTYARSELREMQTNGVLQTTIPVSFTTGYFKAGVYTLANCDNSSPCDTTNYGQNTIYGLSITHT